MKLRSRHAKDIRREKKGAKLVAWLSVAFIVAASYDLTAYAYVQPNFLKESEPNDTQEEADVTQQNTEIASVIATTDYSGRYCILGTTNSLDDDWFKVTLPSGDHYLTVNNSEGQSTYCELLDSENNTIIPKHYATRDFIERFHANGGTYYVHIVGTSESDSSYMLYVGSPRHDNNELNILFTPSSGTIRKSFSLIGEPQLPPDAIVTKLNFINTSVGSATVTSSSSSRSITFSDPFSGEIGSMGLSLKSNWDIVLKPKKPINSVAMRYYFVYPRYDSTEYTYHPTIKK